MKLYKFRPLTTEKHFNRIKDIIKNGFYCCEFLEFNDMNEGVFTINQENSQIRISDKLEYKICSFSGGKALNSQLMWGHYANTGMGVVIEVDVDEDKCGQMKKVNYENSTVNLNTIEEILTRKSKEWEYEDEYRYLSKEMVAKVKIGNIVRMYFGAPYANLVNYEDIKGKHKHLKNYLRFKTKLEKLCSNYILYQDYEYK